MTTGLIQLLKMSSQFDIGSQSSLSQPLSLNSSTPLFSEFCRFLEVASRVRGDAKKKKLQKYFLNWRTKYGNEFYPVMRLLIPHLDNERTSYGMKENVLAKTYINVLGLSKDSPHAERLLHWKLPGSNKNKTAGDFASVAFEVIAPRSTVVSQGSMSIDDVNQQLDTLNASSGQNEARIIIRHFFTKCTAIEQKWIIRIILKELKIGMSEKTIFSAFHPDASSLFNVCSDLRKVCSELQDPHKRFTSSEISIFRPFKPMLSKSVAVQNIIKTMGGNFWIEEKIDGERIQLHMKNGRYEYYSRKATQYTYMYGSNKYEGALTKHIHSCIHDDVQEIILDGEMVPYDPNLDVFQPFGSLKSVCNDKSDDENKCRPCFLVFDIVLLNGKSLANYTLETRRGFLKSLITDKPGYIQVLPHKVGNSMKDLTEAMDDAVMKRKEGIIIKKPSSIYVLNERVDDWIKIKPEYLDTLGDDLDLIVFGADYGQGTRGSKFGSYMCGLRDSESAKIRVLSFCRFGTGFTMKESEELKSLEGWEPLDPNRIPDWLEIGRDKPHMIIPPEKSVVAQVRASEIVPAIDYATNFTLRFPRFEKLRPDKDWSSATSLKEMMHLRKESSGRLQSKKVTEDDLMTTSRSTKRKIRAPQRVRRSTLLETYTSQSGPVEKKSRIFIHKKFYVMVTKYKTFTKADLERMIKENGGEFFQHPDASPNLYIIAESLSNFRIRKLVEAGHHDIIHPRWIEDSISTHRAIPLSPRYMLFITDATSLEFSKRMDRFGDSYTEKVDITTLKEIFDLNPVEEKIFDDSKRRRLNDEIESRYFDDTGLPNAIFRRCVIYIDYPPLIDSSVIDDLWALQGGCRDRLKLIELILRYHDAQVTNDLCSPNITHVIFDERDLSRVDTIKKRYKG
ncbi:ATP-dependent DNA ligase [Gigaspora margarita]|nr:ATP-dependent DNA ligase [Gigaspora margarita]